MRRTAAAILGAITLALITWLIFTLKFVSWDFRSNLWATAYLFWHGRPAYDVATLFLDSSALWLPQIIVLFSPMGLLPLYPATALWLVINIGLLIGIGGYVFRTATQRRPTPLLFSLLILAVVMFPPTGSHLLLGQADMVIMAAILAGTLALSGFLYAIALAKPQLCTLVMPSAVGYVLLTGGDPRKALRLLLMTSLFVFTLTLPFWIANPLWVNSYMSNYYHNPQYVQPSMFSWLHMRWGP